MFPLRLALCAVVLTTSAVAAPVAASGPGADDALSQQAARRHFRRGAAHDKEGRYAAAEAEYREAHRLSGAPELLFNLAQAEERLGKTAQALAHLERYRSERPGARNTDQVGAQIEVLREKDAAEKRARAQAAGEAPAIAAPRPSPPAQVAVVPPGPSGPGMDDLPGTPSRPRGLQAPLALTFSGGALLLTGLGLGLSGLGTAQEINSAPPGSSFDHDRFRQGQGLYAAGLAIGAVGVVVLAAGGIWSAVLLRRAPERRLALLPQRRSLLTQGGF